MPDEHLTSIDRHQAHTRRACGALALLTIATLAALIWTTSASAAQCTTCAPWWGLTAGERPTNLVPGIASDEVQRVTVNATGGNFALAEPVSIEEFFNGTGPPLFTILPYNASHEEVQAGLETVYGAGNVTVSGGPEGHPAVVGTGLNEPYIVTFTGALADRRLKPMNTQLSSLVGLEGEVTVAEQTPGQADGQIIVTAENRGDASTTGKVTIADKLPANLQAASIEGFAVENRGPASPSHGPVSCTLATLTCTFSASAPESLLPSEEIEVRIEVLLKPGASSGEQNTATVSGGGAASASTANHPIEVNGSEHFGAEDFQLIPEDPGGAIDTQAGSHPFQLTNVITLNNGPADSQGRPRPVALPKDILAELPAGFVGNPTPFAQCTDTQFATQPPGNTFPNECPEQSAIGVATVTYSRPEGSPAHQTEDAAVPIFNMRPLPGEPARFGFKVKGFVAAFLDTSVRTGSDYGVTVTSSNITQASSLLSVKLTFWGVPGDASHDSQRGWGCLEGLGTCPQSTATSPPPFLVMPTSCGGFQATLRADSWAAFGHPSQQAEPVTYDLPQAVDGCNHLPFSPSIIVTPDGTAASSPTGLNVDVHVPQRSVLNAESLAESDVKDITVALPEGVAVNPSGGDGLQACSEGLVGYEPPPVSEPPENLHFTPTPKPPIETMVPGLNSCPNASKIGEVTIKSPLLPPGQFVRGFVYLASQNENPFGSLVALYLVATDPISGTLIKLSGETHLTESGQLIGIFKNNPQLAFEDAELHFFGGERAPLATPAHCGPYTTNATFTPWSGNESVNSSSTFNITSGPNGTPCPDASLPFSPSLTGGMINVNAGSFSPLTTTIGRADGNQDMQSVQLHMPAGLEGLLSGVRLCPEAQANEGTCGPESQIGETTVSAGIGNDPVTVTGGRVYITEKYAGAPFGLSIVNPVKAGPFDLEHDTSNPNQNPLCDCVVVRAKIEVDPNTADLTITTDASGPHAIPHLIDGIPVQIKKVNVLVNRQRFTFNPTNCSPLTLTGSIASDEGATQPLSVPFQATNCAVLKFAPKIAVSTAGKTSKATGASLLFKVSYPAGAMGTESWFKQARFQFPKQLPARLTTIQKACLSATFDANPAACPPGSLIGHATVKTPVLPVRLTGPVYFVSHGGAKFPDAVIVLQGYGITVDLRGETFISKAGVTSATFPNTPDVPFETLEVTIPSGPSSEFTANLPARAKGSFCRQKLLMPTRFVAQNGLEINQNTHIAVTGCAKKKLTRAQKLAAAIKACKRKPKHKRAACVREAHRKYGPVRKKTKNK
jgi:hypothetical protein